jgi:3-oxoacyl-[acyl-carrier protein] reductase
MSADVTPAHAVFMPDALRGRVALVTGGSRGLGSAIAQALAAAGAAVAVNYRSGQAAAETVVARIAGAGGKAVAVAGDVGEPAAIDALFESAQSQLGPIEILVNNAGIAQDGLLLRMGVDDWDRVLDVNLRGAFLCSKAALRGMIRHRWGRIVNVSSVVGLMGNAGQANYAAAKAGLLGLTRATAREVASRGITVNAIAPGFIETEMTATLSAAQREAVLREVPLQRFAVPDEIAPSVVFLASDAAAYITGQVLTIDGGMVMA